MSNTSTLAIKSIHAVMYIIGCFLAFDIWGCRAQGRRYLFVVLVLAYWVGLDLTSPHTVCLEACDLMEYKMVQCINKAPFNPLTPTVAIWVQLV